MMRVGQKLKVLDKIFSSIIMNFLEEVEKIEESYLKLFLP
jgi:hypothetical protein